MNLKRTLLLLIMCLMACLMMTDLGTTGHRQITGRVFARGPIWETCGPLIRGGPERFPIVASIQVENEKGEVVAKVFSDVGGNFEIGGLKPGTYIAKADGEGPPPESCVRFFQDERVITLHRKAFDPLELTVGIARGGWRPPTLPPQS